MEWISVNDKLPEKGDFVIIFTKYNWIEYSYEYCGDGEFYESNFDKTRNIDSRPLSKDCNVTHWMPLPLPPNSKNK